MPLFIDTHLLIRAIQGNRIMIVGVHYDIEQDKFAYGTQRIIKTLQYNNIETRLLYAGETSFWEKVKGCDAVIFQWGHRDYYRQIARSILPVIESQMKIRCHPNEISSWLYDDKIREYYCLKDLGFPIIDSWIFYDETNAFDFIEDAKYPLVFKLKSGAGSRTVTLLSTVSEARQDVKIMFRKGVHYDRIMPGTLRQTLKDGGLKHFIHKRLGKLKQKIKNRKIHFQENWSIHRNYILFQKFLPKNQYDTRVIVIGNRAVAFQRFNRPGDFRASGSDSVSLDHQKIDLRFIEIAFEISKKMGFDSMAYDFLYDEAKRPAIAEISYIFGARRGTKIDKCPGYWDENLQFHHERPDVALFTLMHILDEPNLISPTK